MVYRSCIECFLTLWFRLNHGLRQVLLQGLELSRNIWIEGVFPSGYLIWSRNIILILYLLCSGLREDLNKQGFQIVGYGCTTCIGNSGDLDKSVAAAIEGTGNKNPHVYMKILVYFINMYICKAHFLVGPLCHRYHSSCCAIW